MAKTTLIPATDDPGASPVLDCERLDCYRVAVEFPVLAADLGSRRRVGPLRDQLDRESVSIVLSIAEGRRTPADKARCFAIARGSTTECAAALEVRAARGLLAPHARRHGRACWFVSFTADPPDRAPGTIVTLAASIQIHCEARQLWRSGHPTQCLLHVSRGIEDLGVRATPALTLAGFVRLILAG